MNKETRTFIWGLVLLAIGLGCFYLYLKDAHNHSFLWHAFTCTIDVCIMWLGVKKIKKTT